MSEFRIQSDFEPTGHQPAAIEALSAGVRAGAPDQVLLGVTGSGKTFTMACVVEQVQRPTLVMAPNKTLAAQLFTEFRELFPANAVEYCLSAAGTGLDGVDYVAFYDKPFLKFERLLETYLAFAPKGVRLAVAHDNGVTLWFPNMGAKPEFLEWKGSHLGVTFSADNRFLVTSMHEAALHGWRLADSRHMRMTGYPARVRSMSWSAGGKFLATSGSDSVILWPFASKDGPMGKEPGMLAPLQAKATVVACHPRDDVFAVGYSDGTILMVRIEDGAELARDWDVTGDGVVDRKDVDAIAARSVRLAR